MAHQQCELEPIATSDIDFDSPCRLTHAEFVNLNPSRDPAWRYERAKFIVSELGEDYEADREDSLTLLAADFLIQRRSLSEKKSISETRLRQLLTDYFPVLAPVIELFENPENDALRQEIEARILARQTDTEIAEMTGLPANVVEMYEQLFCCIRDVIDKVDYITGMIGPVLRAGLENVPLWRFYKYIAYFMGHQVLELYLHSTTQSQSAASHDDQNASSDAWKDVAVRLEMLRISTCASTEISDVIASITAYDAMFPKEAEILPRSEKANWLGPVIKSMQDS